LIISPRSNSPKIDDGAVNTSFNSVDVRGTISFGIGGFLGLIELDVVLLLLFGVEDVICDL
jgi:hypothetical protein